MKFRRKTWNLENRLQYRKQTNFQDEEKRNPKMRVV
jgi:hypothetical protein